MANWYDNFLEITSRKPIDWIETINTEWYSMDDKVQIWSTEDYAFNFSAIEEIQINGLYKYRASFDTKWSQPTEYYLSLKENEDITDVFAQWYEGGCGILWHFNLEEGIVDEKCPSEFYSDLLDKTYLSFEPSQTWIDMRTEDYSLSSSYKNDLNEAVSKGTITRDDANEELEENEDSL